MTKLQVLKIGGRLFSVETVKLIGVIACLYFVYDIHQQNAVISEQLIDINVRCR